MAPLKWVEGKLNLAMFSNLPWRNESEIHAHVPEERPGEFSSCDPGGMELEVMEFVYSLVRLFKPQRVIETGTGGGYGTLAIASGLDQNQNGELVTVEIDPQVIESAKGLISGQEPSCLGRIRFVCGDSLEVIGGIEGGPFEMAVIDSVIDRRIAEFELLRKRGLLASEAICLFHDSSRLRGQSMHDFDENFIDQLDALSLGSQWLESYLSRGLRLLRLP